MYFAEAGGFVDCPIYDRYALGAGATFAGPGGRRGVRLDHSSSIRATSRVDDVGNLVIEEESA